MERVNILGVGISAINMEDALDAIAKRLESDVKGYICISNVYSIMEAQRSERLKRVLNESFLTTPDGVPTVWLGHFAGFSKMGRVYGPDLMLRTCEWSVGKGYTHYLYGGQPGVALELKNALESKFPGIKIVGTYTPPFRELNNDEQAELQRDLDGKKPDIFWVGISTPKQDIFMAQYLPRLNTKLMFGVGAAFDFHTGRMKESPDWMKRVGLQWLHRLIQEPRRLWKRYCINNPLFVFKVLGQILGLKRYSLSRSVKES